MNNHLKEVRITPEAFTHFFIYQTGIKFEVVDGLSEEFKCIGMQYMANQNEWRLVFSDGKHSEGEVPERDIMITFKEYPKGEE